MNKKPEVCRKLGTKLSSYLSPITCILTAVAGIPVMLLDSVTHASLPALGQPQSRLSNCCSGQENKERSADMSLKTVTAHFTKSFNIEDAAIVLIDHQIGTCGWVHSIDRESLEKNVNILATFATGMKDATRADLIHVCLSREPL